VHKETLVIIGVMYLTVENERYCRLWSPDISRVHSPEKKMPTATMKVE